ncbi:MAG: alanine racemase [Candidatus Cloacimonetes bacterium]|nr:alanine racemase [Candidatus Cloacimonadota bacterium]
MQNERSWTEIDLSNFEHNLNELKKFFTPGVNFMQIVKADAYGHGAFEISKKAIQCGATFLGVANVQEGMLLRYQGIRIPIVILSPSMENEIEQILENDLIPTISTFEFAIKLNKKGKCKIHINIDTGMGRSGIHFQQALTAISIIQLLPNLTIEGIFSHFSAAENDEEYTIEQSQKFAEILSKLNFKPKYIHIANSSGMITSKDNYSNLVRLGLLSYGVYTDPSLKNIISLKPVMTFKSRIGQIKTAEKGESIGYNRTYITPDKMKYAILPVGYADGYDFMLSNKGKVLIKNELCDVIGKISMDMIAVDITKLDASVGDVVVLLGNEHDAIKAENLTSLYNGSSYEILCQVGRRAKRYYYENGKIIASSPLLRRDFVSFDYSDDKLNTVIETAIEQRLQSKEISSLIYSDILKRFFTERDRDIHYRRNFKHTIEFKDSTSSPFSRGNKRSPATDGRGLTNYYLTNTTLTFFKQLQNDHFYIACANSEKLLEKYFLRIDVEYRWLLDNKLEANLFDVTSAKINDIELNHEMKIFGGCIEICCHHPQLKELVGKEVQFSISTQTFYPKDSHQVSVYLIELTQGVKITFIFGDVLQNVEPVPIFSGRSKFPQISTDGKSITISSKKDEWVFPTSGVVFVY